MRCLQRKSISAGGTPRLRQVETGRRHRCRGCRISALAQPQRFFQNRIKHRRQIAGRGVDDLQHLGCRSLLFQRLPLFGQKSCVLDRDHRLIGEGADKCDLPVGERLAPRWRASMMTPIGSPSRNKGTSSPVRSLPSDDGHVWIIWDAGDIVNVNSATLHGLVGIPGKVAETMPADFPLARLVFWWPAKVCHQLKSVALALVDRQRRHHTVGRLLTIVSNTGCKSTGERLITCNTSAVAVCYSSASRCWVMQSRVLDRDHRLIGEGADKIDLPVGERLDPDPSEIDVPIRNAIAHQWDTKKVRCLPV